MVTVSGPSQRFGGTRPELSRTGVIKNSVNVHRSSIRLTNAGEQIVFKFDASLPTRFRIYFNCSEFLNDKKFPILASELEISESDLFPACHDGKFEFALPKGLTTYDENVKVFPVIVETVPTNGDGSEAASQLTYLTVNEQKVTVLKQKLRYGEKGYDLHEIFGNERTASADRSPASASYDDDINGTDCVICLTNPRDTTIIPCLHLCLCSQCAQVLSLNTRKCPVCRTPATGLLQIDRDLPPPSPLSPSKAVKLPE